MGLAGGRPGGRARQRGASPYPVRGTRIHIYYLYSYISYLEKAPIGRTETRLIEHNVILVP